MEEEHKSYILCKRYVIYLTFIVKDRFQIQVKMTTTNWLKISSVTWKMPHASY